jgi:hypothetical protein
MVRSFPPQLYHPRISLSRYIALRYGPHFLLSSLSRDVLQTPPGRNCFNDLISAHLFLKECLDETICSEDEPPRIVRRQHDGPSFFSGTSETQAAGEQKAAG